MIEMKNKCPKCEYNLEFVVDKKYYKHNNDHQHYNIHCNFIASEKEYKQILQKSPPLLKIFICSEKNYYKYYQDDINYQTIVKDFINYTINHNQKFLQTGRFIPIAFNHKNKDKQIVNDMIDDCFYDCLDIDVKILLEQDIKNIEIRREQQEKEKINKLLPELVTQQIKGSNLLYAVFTKENQIQLIAEIHMAIALFIPVYLKFCNCDQYDFYDIYRFTIESVFQFMKNRQGSFSFNCFKNISILNNNWKNELDYLNYLHQLNDLVCKFCHQTYSSTYLLKLKYYNDFNIDDDIDINFDIEDDDNSSNCYMCVYCYDIILNTLPPSLSNVKSIIFKYLYI